MTEVDAERARKMAREAVERYPNGGLHTVARWALELDARVRELETWQESAGEEYSAANDTIDELRMEVDEATARAERAEADIVCLMRESDSHARLASRRLAEVGHLRAALKHIRRVCRIGASPEWACRAARGLAEATLGERGTREEPSDDGA